MENVKPVISGAPGTIMLSRILPIPLRIVTIPSPFMIENSYLATYISSLCDVAIAVGPYLPANCTKVLNEEEES